MKPELFLFEFPEGQMVGDWRQTLEKRAEQTPFEYDIPNHRLRLWDPRKTANHTPRSDITYRDGLEFVRVDLGGSRTRTTVGVSICRVYFKDGGKWPVVESQAELFGTQGSPEIPRHIEFIPSARALLKIFNGENPVLTPLDKVKYGSVDESVHLQFARNRCLKLADMAKNSYSKNILARIRNHPAAVTCHLHLLLLPLFSQDKEKAKLTARAVAEVLANEWSCPVTRARVENQDELNAWMEKTNGQNRVVLIPLDGVKGDRPTDTALKWMGYLSDMGIAFHLCSTMRDPKNVRHGLACALLAKSGGLLYQTATESVPDLCDHWCIGLDLGYGGEYDNRIAVITLSDGYGQLRAYWRAIKDTDETLAEDVLRDGLGWIMNKAESLLPGKKILVFRDGIRPKNERLEVYLEMIPQNRSTLIELSKKGNPLFTDNDSAPTPGSFGIADQSDKIFLYPVVSPQKGILTNPVKISCPHNGLNYSQEQLCEITAALCHAPKLSFQASSMPSPIYWADGLAGLSASNLQFAGWSHLPHQTRDLRSTND